MDEPPKCKESMRQTLFLAQAELLHGMTPGRLVLLDFSVIAPGGSLSSCRGPPRPQGWRAIAGGTGVRPLVGSVAARRPERLAEVD